MMVRMADFYELDSRAATALVTLAGELDAHDAPALREGFAAALEALSPLGREPTLVLDLTDVEFLDSTALGTMVGALRRVRDAGGQLRVVLPVTTARRIFEITGLDEVLDVYPSRDVATSR